MEKATCRRTARCEKELGWKGRELFEGEVAPRPADLRGGQKECPSGGKWALRDGGVGGNGMERGVGINAAGGRAGSRAFTGEAVFITVRAMALHRSRRYGIRQALESAGDAGPDAA